MLPLYLFCLVVGGGLLLFSLLGSDAGGDAGAAPHDGGDGSHEFFSLRALTYFLTGFGATGALLVALTGAAPGVAALWAGAAGTVAATGSAALFGWMRRTESGLVPVESDHLVGLAGEVTLAVEGERRGKVVVVSGGREVELLARLYSPEDPACPRGARVVVVDMEGMVALVTPLPAFPPDLA